MKGLTVALVAFLALLQGSQEFTYEGFKLFKLVAETRQQAEHVHSLTNNEKLNFLKEARRLNDPTYVVVAPEDQQAFQEYLAGGGVKNEVVVENVESVIQQERMERALTRSLLLPGDVTFTNFMFFDEQMAYLRGLAQKYPNIAKLEHIGKSYEGRNISLLRISSGSSATPKPAIFIDAGIHAREWIAPPTALYIIQQLVENSANAALLQNVDWFIIPNLNPDGYEFTQTRDRLWRKNRRPLPGSSCIGTDLNRNFDYMWMFDGASSNPCAETFAGSGPLSEPESQALVNWLSANGQNVKLYLTVHSYGEMLLYPWGYAPILPDNHVELQQLGERVTAAIDGASRMGSRYVVHNSAIYLYPAAGGSDDWAKVKGIELSYTLELPNGDALFPFMIPARQILPVVQETWEGVKQFFNYIEEKFVLV